METKIVEVTNGFIAYVTKDDETKTYVIEGKRKYQLSTALSEILGESDGHDD